MPYDQNKELVDFFSTYPEFYYDKHDIIIQPGDEPDSIYYITNGFVKQYATSLEGQELILNIFGPHSFFYAIFQPDGSKHDYYFSGLTMIEGHKAPRHEVKEFMHGKPEVLAQLLERRQYGIIGMFSRMEALVFGNAQSKVATAIVFCANRFGLPGIKKGEIRLDLPLTHKEIGHIAGLTRESVSYEMAEFQKQGIISMNKHIVTIHNMESLLDESVLNQEAERRKWGVL